MNSTEREVWTAAVAAALSGGMVTESKYGRSAASVARAAIEAADAVLQAYRERVKP